MQFLNTLWSNTNYRIATIIAVLMGLWLVSGIFVSDDKEAEENARSQQAAEDAALPQVRAQKIQSQMYPLHVVVKGRTEADRIVEVKAEVGGQVEELVVEKGGRVKAGQTICRLAIEDRELRLQEAEAAVQQAKIDYDGALRLKTGGFQSETAIANAKAKLEAMKANALRRKIDIEKTQIKAPFAGVVDEQTVEVGTLMRAGDTCATILDLDPLVVSGQVSEADVIRIPRDAEVKVKLGTGEELVGNIRYVARNAENVTRTFRVEAAVPNESMELFSGITTEMEIVTGDVPAHLISATLLLLDDEGELAVRTLNENDEVEVFNVRVVGDATEGVWVSGLPDKVTLITVGQEYVTVGEKVAAMYETGSMKPKQDQPVADTVKPAGEKSGTSAQSEENSSTVDMDEAAADSNQSDNETSTPTVSADI